MKNFKSYQLSVQFYKNCKALNCECHLKDQLLRAASSAALNLSEGSAKSSRAEQRKFFEIAYASIRESKAVLELADLNNTEHYQLADHAAAAMYNLLKSLGRR